MRFDVEWLDAPGVRDAVLAATWARLRIEVGGRDVTELIHVPSDSRRSAIYGPVLPLVEWLVENWWSILHEPAMTSPLRPGRGAAPWLLDWTKRHNLLAAREGTALPDATFVRDGDEIVVCWVPDPNDQATGLVRFVGSGQVRVPAAAFEGAASTLINATLARCAAQLDESIELEPVRSAWAAVQASDAAERLLCRGLAMLGLDPYDPDPSTEQLESLLSSLAVDLSPTLYDDLLETASPNTLEAAATWLRGTRLDFLRAPVARRHATLPPEWTAGAHQTGYRLARQARSVLLQLAENEPISDLDSLLVDRMGWDATPVRDGVALKSLDGLVGVARDSERPTVIVPGTRTGWGRRFLLARGAFFVVSDTLHDGRLLTSAVTRSQRTARAFAAELLAPASALASRVQGLVSEEDVAGLSDEFGVNPLLIKHQLENHGIGSMRA